MKYSFITQHKNTFPVRLMCQVLGVDRSVITTTGARWTQDRLIPSMRKCWSGFSGLMMRVIIPTAADV